MRVLLASAAYLTVAAGGVKMLVASAHTLATAASPFLVLPPAPTPAPSLVERRLIAQAAPAPEYTPLRRVVALKAPDMPIAQLAQRLDDAETAYEPTHEVRVIELLEPLAVPAVTVVQDAIKDSSPPLLQVAALEITRAEFGQPTIVLASKRKPKQSVAKRKIKPAVIAKLRGPVRLASFETPGLLMNRAFLKGQS